MKNVAVLGATGSIGASALAVLTQHADRFRPLVLTANSNRRALEQLVERWRPEIAVLADAPEGPREPWASGAFGGLEVPRPMKKATISSSGSWPNEQSR